MPKGCRDSQVQTHHSPPAQRSSASSCSCSTPLGSCSTTDLLTRRGKGNTATAGNSLVMFPHTHFASWEWDRGTGTSCLPLGLPVGGQQRNTPLRSLLQGASPAWEHLQAVKAMASGVLPGSLGSANSLSCIPKQVPACMEATGPWATSGYRYNF